jgi:hypothetical protein
MGRRQHEDRDGAVAAESAADLHSGHSREHQVEDEHVVPVAPHGLESGFAVRDGIDVESLRP